MILLNCWCNTPNTYHEGKELKTFMLSDLYLHLQGGLICKCLDKQGVSFCTRMNANEIYESLRSETHLLASKRVYGVREYEMVKFQLLNQYGFPWLESLTLMSPNYKFLLLLEITTMPCLLI